MGEVNVWTKKTRTGPLLFKESRAIFLIGWKSILVNDTSIFSLNKPLNLNIIIIKACGKIFLRPTPTPKLFAARSLSFPNADIVKLEFLFWLSLFSAAERERERESTGIS